MVMKVSSGAVWRTVAMLVPVVATAAATTADTAEIAGLVVFDLFVSALAVELP